MNTAHQQPTDLVFGLVRTDFPLTVIQQAHIAVQAWVFVFQIIGESHAVRIEHNGQHFFTEVLACLDLPQDSHLHHFADLAAYHYQHDHYTMSVDFEQTLQLPALPPAQVIQAAFPQVHGRTPVTRISWQIRENSVAWETWHTYPAQNGGIRVKSESGFRII